MKDMQDNQQHGTISGITVFLATFIIAAIIAVILLTILGSFNQASTEPANQPSAKNQTTSTEVNKGNGPQQQRAQSAKSQSDQQGFAVSISRFPEGLIRSKDTIVETSSIDGGNQLTADLESEDQLSEVFSYYTEWLGQNNFEIRRSSQANGLIVASASSSDVAIEVSEQGSDGSEVMVTYNK